MDYLFQSLDKNMEAFRSDWLPEVNATLKQFEEYFRKTREGIKQFKKTGSFIEVPEDIEGTVPHKDLSKNVKQERVTALMMPLPLKPVKRTRRQKIKTEKVSDDSENEGMERAESSHDLNLEVKQEVVRQSAQPFTRVTRGLSKRFIEQNKDDDCVIVTPHVETVNLNDSVDSSNCHSLSNKQSDQTAAGKTAENKPNDSVIKTKSVQSCESLPITRTTRTKTRQIQQKEENSKEQGANSSSQEIPKSTNEKDEERSRTKKTFIIQKPDIVESAQDVRCTRSRVRKQVEEQVVLNPPIEQVTSTNLKSAVSRIVDEVQDKRLRSPAVDDNAQAAKRSKISRMRLKLSSTDLVVGNENESNTCDQTFVVPNKNKEPTPPNSNLKEVNLVKKNKECWPAQGKLKSPPFVAAKFVQTKPKPVFNLYENSPVKKKVAAYEKLDEAKTFVFTAKQKRQQKLEGATETMDNSVMHLSDSITLSVRNPPPRTESPQKSDAKAVANILATRGITVTASAKPKEKPQSSITKIPTPPPTVTLNLNNAVSIIPTAKNSTVKTVKSPEGRLQTIDLTDDDTSENASRQTKPPVSPQKANQRSLPFRCDLCPAQYPNSMGLSKHRQSYHKTGSACDIGVPLIDLKQPGIAQKVSSLGIYNYIPLLGSSPDGNFALPVVSMNAVKNSSVCNLNALGASSVLTLGPVRSLPRPQQNSINANHK